MARINLDPMKPISTADSAALDYATAYSIPLAFGPELMPMAKSRTSRVAQWLIRVSSDGF